MTPDCRNKASTVTSDAASSAPVCDEVARAPTAERPDLSAIIGLSRPTEREASELTRIAERLQIQQNHLGPRVGVPVAEQIVARNIGLVAHRHDGRKAKSARVGEIYCRQTERATVRCQSDRTSGWHEGSERSVQRCSRVGIDDADAVRANQAHAMCTADLQQLTLALLSV